MVEKKNRKKGFPADKIPQFSLFSCFFQALENTQINGVKINLQFSTTVNHDHLCYFDDVLQWMNFKSKKSFDFLVM